MNDIAAANSSSRRRRARTWISGALVAGVVAVGVVGYVKYNDTANELDALRAQESDRTAAAQTAKEYALKSLTYDYADTDAFFHAVEDGVAPALRDKYVNSADLLKGIMAQAQVVSTGEILSAEATPATGGAFAVVVTANQATKNLQSPQLRTEPIVLQVTVGKSDDAWQVADIGPREGARAAVDQQAAPAPVGVPPVADKPGS